MFVLANLPKKAIYISSPTLIYSQLISSAAPNVLLHPQNGSKSNYQTQLQRDARYQGACI